MRPARIDRGKTIQLAGEQKKMSGVRFDRCADYVHHKILKLRRNVDVRIRIAGVRQKAVTPGWDLIVFRKFSVHGEGCGIAQIELQFAANRVPVAAAQIAATSRERIALRESGRLNVAVRLFLLAAKR